MPALTAPSILHLMDQDSSAAAALSLVNMCKQDDKKIEQKDSEEAAAKISSEDSSTPASKARKTNKKKSSASTPKSKGANRDSPPVPTKESSYRDLSHLASTIPPAPAASASADADAGSKVQHTKEPTFPVKLHMILSNPEFSDIVSWLPRKFCTIWILSACLFVIFPLLFVAYVNSSPVLVGINQTVGAGEFFSKRHLKNESFHSIFAMVDTHPLLDR
jgi:Ca2+-dependent lipid-binding protein